MRGASAAGPFLTLLLTVGAGAGSPVQAQAAGEVDSGRFRIERAGQQVATEVFAIRREASSVKSVARLTAGGDSAVLADRITEARLQTNTDHEPVLFELQVQRGQQLDLVGVRSGDRFRVRTRTRAGERWKEFLVPSGLILLPDGFAHFHHFLFRQREGEARRLTALLPAEGIRRQVRLLASRPDTISAGGEQRRATRWEVRLGEERRLIWRDAEGRVLRVEVPSRDWVARRVPGSGPSGVDAPSP